jgi:hypothetical protein
MDLEPIRTTCPVCGDADVAYTCTPGCCFNHVCAACRASWQLATEVVDVGPIAVESPRDDYDTTDPSAPCFRCGELVWQLSGRSELWCPSCGIALKCIVRDVRPFATSG